MNNRSLSDREINGIIRLSNIVIVLLICALLGLAGDVFGQDVEVQTISPRTASMVCSAAAIIAEDEELAGWFATIVDDEDSIEYFLGLFAAGLESESITNEDIADTVEACIIIRTDVEALE